MDEATAALIGAALGAGGAVTAQLIGSFFTQRSERKRFEWEQDEAERRRKEERLARFVDHKRDLYTRYLTLHTNFSNVALRRGDPERHNTHEELMDRYLIFTDQETLLRQEIAMIAPGLAPVLDAALQTAVTHFTRRLENESDWQEPLQLHRDAIRACREAMSLELGLGEDGYIKAPMT